MKKSLYVSLTMLLVSVLLTVVGCSNSSTSTATTVTTITTSTVNTSVPTSSAPGPVVSITNPNDGDTGTPINVSISATFDEAVNPSTINNTTFVLTQGAIVVPSAVSVYGKVAVLNPTTDLAKDTVYTATITSGVTMDSGVTLASDFTWSFTTGELDTVNPTVVNTIPSFAITVPEDPNNPFGGSINVPVNDSIVAVFSEAMDPFTINTDTFTLKLGSTPVQGIVNFDGDNTATFTPSDLLAQNSTYTATITTGATCLGGNGLSQDFSWSFTTGATQSTAPTVESTYPAMNATDLPINSSIIISFSEAINAMSINSSTFTLWQGTNNIPGTVTFDGIHTATFDPIADLAVDTTYTAKISTGVTDIAGIPMASDYTWVFTTGSADTTTPTVLSTSPADGAEGIINTTNITVTFSEAVDPTTLVFSLEQGSNMIFGSSTFNDALTVMTFTPALGASQVPALAANTTYTASVSVSDAAGYGPATQTWSFTTAP